MHTLDSDLTSGLLDAAVAPCLSLYQPTHREYPDNQQDSIRFRSLIDTMEASLRTHHATHVVDSLMAPFRALAEDRAFWSHTLDGLAVLGSSGLFRVYPLQQSVSEMAVVADTFHVKPLLNILQASDRYQILGVTRTSFSLYVGNRDVLDQIDLEQDPMTAMAAQADAMLADSIESMAARSGGDSHLPNVTERGSPEDGAEVDAERFFRIVDREILDHHSRPSGLPLILATLPENRASFHHISKNPFLLEQGIDVYPDSVPLDELRARAWTVVEPHYLARMASQLAAFGAARASALGDDSLADVARAVVTGRVGTLFIEGEREIPGRIDATTGDIHLADMGKHDVDDVLDDLGMMARKRGGKVVIVPSAQMPTDSGVAAIYRY
jgi:hypothetical protein